MGMFRLRARTLADPEDGGGPPSLDTGSHLPEPKRTTEGCTAASSERVKTRCHTQAHTHTPGSEAYITPDRQHAHGTCKCMHMCTHACTPHATLAYTPHTQCTRMQTHALTCTHHTQTHTTHACTGPGGCPRPLSRFMLPACSGLRPTRQARPCVAATRGPKEAGPPDFRESEKPQAAGQGQEAERASHTE